MEMSFPCKTARMSPSHGYSADTAEHNDDQDTDGDGQDCHHWHRIFDGKSDSQSQDATAIVNH